MEFGGCCDGDISMKSFLILDKIKLCMFSVKNVLDSSCDCVILLTIINKFLVKCLKFNCKEG